MVSSFRFIIIIIIILPLFQQGTQTETKVSFTAGLCVHMFTHTVQVQ